MNIKLMQWNIRSFNAQRIHLIDAIDNKHPDIICLQETLLKPNKQVRLPSFQNPPCRKDRVDGGRGGVMIYVQPNIPYSDVTIDTTLEACAIQAYFDQKTITVCSLYLPPNLPDSIISEKLDSLQEQLPSPFIILTDANAHHMSWGSNSNSGRVGIVADWIDRHNLFLLNSGEPTYLSSSGNYSQIDLTIYSQEIATLFNWEPQQDTYNSDHFPIMVSTSLGLSTPPTAHWNFSKADWKNFSNTLNLPESFSSPSTACEEVTEAILGAALASIPKSNKTLRPSSHWWNAKCSLAKREKNAALSRYKNHRGNINLWIEYKRRKAIFRQTLLRAKKESWEEFLCSFSSKSSATQVWKKVKLLSSKPRNHTIVLKEDNITVSSSTQIANLLASSFSSSGSNNPTFLEHKIQFETNQTLRSQNDCAWFNTPLTYTELTSALSTCSSNSPGPDGVTYSMLKHLNKAQTYSLLAFYNFLLCNGFPDQWKEATVIPILKPNKPANNKFSYRPIALLSCLSKLYEMTINKRLLSFLEGKQFFTPFQSGFRAGHSTYDALCRLESDVRAAILNRRVCLAVFLDITKAFDKVWHAGLLHKLATCGLSGQLLNFATDFLSGRHIRVRVGGELSNRHLLLWCSPEICLGAHSVLCYDQRSFSPNSGTCTKIIVCR